MIVRRGLRRPRRSRWVSLLLAALAVTALLTGLGSATGLLLSVGGFRGIWLHVAAALALVPLVVWHVLARPAHAHRTDLSRRTPLRAGTLRVRRRRLRRHHRSGPRRRAAGRKPALHRFLRGRLDPAAMPTTSWIDDVAPEVDPATWCSGRRRRRRRARALA